MEDANVYRIFGKEGCCLSTSVSLVKGSKSLTVFNVLHTVEFVLIVSLENNDTLRKNNDTVLKNQTC